MSTTPLRSARPKTHETAAAAHPHSRAAARPAPAAHVEPVLLHEAAGLFGLLSSATRLHIVWLLAQGEQDVTTLAEAVGCAVPAVSQHLAKLRLSGLVTSRREGRRQVYLIADLWVAEAVLQAIAALPEPGAASGPGDA